MRHGPGSVPVLDIRDAAAGRPVIWLVDSSEGSDPGQDRLLHRFGTVVDMAGRSGAEVAAEVAPARPGGLLTFFDRGMVMLAEVAAELGLPFHSPATALAVVDKNEQRDRLRAGGLETPRTWLIEGGSWVVPADMTWPAVLKPCEGFGSRNVTLVADAGAVQAVVDATGGERLLLEEYLSDGPVMPVPEVAQVISVESVAIRGLIHHVAVSGRYAFLEPFREGGLFLPGMVPEGAEQAMLDVVDRAAAALGIEHGCVHTELKFTADGPRVVEVNGRLGGTVPGMARRAMGIDLFEIAVRVAEGEEVELATLAPADRIAFHLYVQPPTVVGELQAITGIEEIAALPGVEEVIPLKSPGQLVDYRVGTFGLVAAVVGTVSSYDELIALEEHIRRVVRPVFAPS